MANIFPRSSNLLPLKIVFCLLVLGGAVSSGMWYYFTPKYTRVGYQPTQPVPFSHKIHAGQLGMDCRYCHSFVETAAHSNVPTTQVCMNCHNQVQKDNPKLQAVRDSWQTGKPIESGEYYHFRPAQGLFPTVAEAAGAVSGRSLLSLAEERLESERDLEDSRRLLQAALAQCLEGRELTTRAVAKAVARRGHGS